MTVTDAQVKAAKDVYCKEWPVCTSADTIRRMLEAAEQVEKRQWWWRKSDGSWQLLDSPDNPALIVDADGRYSAWPVSYTNLTLPTTPYA